MNARTRINKIAKEHNLIIEELYYENNGPHGSYWVIELNVHDESKRPEAWNGENWSTTVHNWDLDCTIDELLNTLVV